MAASHRRKLARGEFHIQNLEAMLTRWRRDGYRTFEEPNGKGRFVFFAEQTEPLPDQLPVVIGDVFQCLRNSLDHIIFALSQKNPAMTAQDEHKPAFPIYDTVVADSDRVISFLEQAARDDVRALAPDPARQPLNQDPLWLLNKMSNRDKHREITATPLASSGANHIVVIESDGTDYFRSFGGQHLKPQAGPMPILEFARSPGVKAEIGHAVQILFDQGVEVENREVVPALRWFHDHIGNTVFECLEQHL